MKYLISDKKPSKMFLRSLKGGGSHDAYCSCGRQHYCPDSNSLYDGDGGDDEGDRIQYLANALQEKEKDPEGVVIHYDEDFVATKDIDGKTFVEECPCNDLRRYEEWVWNNRDIIREYLCSRVKQEAIWAEQEMIKNKLAGI